MNSDDIDMPGFHRKRHNISEMLRYGLTILPLTVVLAFMVGVIILLYNSVPSLLSNGLSSGLNSISNYFTIQVPNVKLEMAATNFMRGYMLDGSAPIKIGAPAGTTGLATLLANPSDVDTSHILPQVPRGWGVLEFVEVPQVAPITSASTLTYDLQSGLHKVDWWGVGYTQRQLQIMSQAKQAYVLTKLVDGRQEALVFLFYSDKPPAN